MAQTALTPEASEVKERVARIMAGVMAVPVGWEVAPALAKPAGSANPVSIGRTLTTQKLVTASVCGVIAVAIGVLATVLATGAGIRVANGR